MNEPLISVVIPVYNEEKRVARAIRSMQDQTYKNIEIIVVDDGSTDTTPSVIKKITEEDQRVSFYTNPAPAQRTNWRGYDINAGYAARNYGFKIARGEWITTQDADDASLLNRVEVQYELAKKYGAICVTVGWQKLTEHALDKELNVEEIFSEKSEDGVVIQPHIISAHVKKAQGILMIEPIHSFIPFPIKWFPYTRKLFYRHTQPYLGADNCMFFHRQVRDDGVYMRHRNQRTWGAPSGRGSGRDFASHIAARYKNSWSFKLPLYLWDVNLYNEEYRGYEKYLV